MEEVLAPPREEDIRFPLWLSLVPRGVDSPRNNALVERRRALYRSAFFVGVERHRLGDPRPSRSELVLPATAEAPRRRRTRRGRAEARREAFPIYTEGELAGWDYAQKANS